MAKEGGEQSPAWAPSGSGPVGGVAHIPQPCPVSHRTHCVHPVRWGLEDWCVPCGVEQNSSLGKPWPGLAWTSQLLSWPGRSRWRIRGAWQLFYQTARA